MDQNIEKAFEISNLMVTIANQKRVLKEEYDQNLMYFESGGIFKANNETIVYVKTLKELTKEKQLVILDTNQTPILILDIEKFLESLLDKHFQANNAYYSKFEKLKTNRNIKNILDL